jgi:hypothetical protein
LGSVKQQAKLLKLDGKEFRNDFMVENGRVAETNSVKFLV